MWWVTYSRYRWHLHTKNLEGTVSQVCTVLVWKTFSLSCCYSDYYYCYQYLIIYSNTISFSCGTLISTDRYHEITIYELRSCSFSCLGFNFGFVQMKCDSLFLFISIFPWRCCGCDDELVSYPVAFRMWIVLVLFFYVFSFVGLLCCVFCSVFLFYVCNLPYRRCVCTLIIKKWIELRIRLAVRQ